MTVLAEDLQQSHIKHFLILDFTDDESFYAHIEKSYEDYIEESQSTALTCAQSIIALSIRYLETCKNDGDKTPQMLTQDLIKTKLTRTNKDLQKKYAASETMDQRIRE